MKNQSFCVKDETHNQEAWKKNIAWQLTGKFTCDVYTLRWQIYTFWVPFQVKEMGATSDELKKNIKMMRYASFIVSRWLNIIRASVWSKKQENILLCNFVLCVWIQKLSSYRGMLTIFQIGHVLWKTCFELKHLEGTVYN